MMVRGVTKLSFFGPVDLVFFSEHSTLCIVYIYILKQSVFENRSKRGKNSNRNVFSNKNYIRSKVYRAYFQSNNLFYKKLISNQIYFL